MLGKFFGQVRGDAVAYTALFVALSGTAVAATSALPANSVGTAQLKSGAVTGQKVASNTLTGANIKASTLGTVPNSSELGGVPASSYGKVTSITAGTGLTGGGTSGTVTLNADETVLQHRIGGCSTGEAIQSVDSTGSPTCLTVGNVSAVTAGTGLTNSGSSSNVTLNVDPSAVQSRVSGTCASSSAIASVAQNGTVSCQSTNVTEMLGGSGTQPLSNSADNYLSPQGISTPTTNLAAVQMGTSALPTTAKDLAATVSAPPGATNTGWEILFVVNGTIESGLNAPDCAILHTATTCTDTVDTQSIPANARVAIFVVADGSPAPATLTFGWTDVS